MSGPQRAPDQTAISVSIGKELLAKIDLRASALGISRSQYLANLARADVARGGDLVLKEEFSSSPDAQTAEARAVQIAQREAVSYSKPKNKKKPVK